MIESFIITSRETLEASLVIGIVLVFLKRTNNNKLVKWAWYGVLAGIIASILAALLFNVIAEDFSGKNEMIFEGITMLIGAILLTSMIWWMTNQKKISKKIENRLGKYLGKKSIWFSNLGIFLLVFTSVIREGVETVIFLNAAQYSSTQSFLGGLLGVLFAIFLGMLIFMGTKKINLKRLFNASSILLILFAGGLVIHGMHEFVEAEIIPGIITPLYDLENFLSDKSVIGSFLKGLVGYISDPSLVEVAVYLIYIGFVTALFFKFKRNIKVSGRTIPN